MKNMKLAIRSFDECGFSDGSAGKEYTCNAGDTGNAGSIPGLGRSLEEERQPTPVVLPEKSHE